MTLNHNILQEQIIHKLNLTKCTLDFFASIQFLFSFTFIRLAKKVSINYISNKIRLLFEIVDLCVLDGL